MPSKKAKEYLTMISRAVGDLTTSCSNVIFGNFKKSSRTDGLQAKLNAMSPEELVEFVKEGGEWSKILSSSDVLAAVAQVNQSVAEDHISAVEELDNSQRNTLL